MNVNGSGENECVENEFVIKFVCVCVCVGEEVSRGRRDRERVQGAAPTPTFLTQHHNNTRRKRPTRKSKRAKRANFVRMP